MDAKAAKVGNDAYSKMIRHALKEAIPFMAIPAVSVSLIEVVKATWHDSSNAGFNWYVISPEHSPPEYHEMYGKPPVDAKFTYRSLNGKQVDINLVAASVLTRELPKIKQAYKTHKGKLDLSFWNAIELSGYPNYEENAEIYKTLHDPEVTVAFARNTAVKFAEWQATYGF